MFEYFMNTVAILGTLLYFGTIWLWFLWSLKILKRNNYIIIIKKYNL